MHRSLPDTKASAFAINANRTPGRLSSHYSETIKAFNTINNLWRAGQSPLHHKAGAFAINANRAPGGFPGGRVWRNDDQENAISRKTNT